MTWLALVLACSPVQPDCSSAEYCRAPFAGDDCAGEGVCTPLPESPAELVLWLPIAAGETLFCAKGGLRPRGSHGVCSDTGRFALDLATPATLAPHVILAAADGTAFPFGGCSSTNLDRGHDDRCNLGWGNVVHVEHPGGVFTLYAHLSSIFVQAGEHVVAGQPIGVEGNTGAAGGKHLHFGLQRGDAKELGAGTSLPIAQLKLDGLTLPSTAVPCGDWTADGQVHAETQLRSQTPRVAPTASRFLAEGTEPHPPAGPEVPTWPWGLVALPALALGWWLGRRAR